MLIDIKFISFSPLVCLLCSSIRSFHIIYNIDVHNMTSPGSGKLMNIIWTKVQCSNHSLMSSDCLNQPECWVMSTVDDSSQKVRRNKEQRNRTRKKQNYVPVTEMNTMPWNVRRRICDGAMLKTKKFIFRIIACAHTDQTRPDIGHEAWMSYVVELLGVECSKTREPEQNREWEWDEEKLLNHSFGSQLNAKWELRDAGTSFVQHSPLYDSINDCVFHE